MQPAPPLDGALPTRRSQRSTPAVATKSTPSACDAYARSLLAKRVLSVDEFRQERVERARQNPPPLPRGIPVPLYPKETLEQYNSKFQLWLEGKNERLEEMRDDPKRERKLWLTFAFRREKTETSRGQKRSLDDEYEDFYRRSASLERKRVRQGGASMESDTTEPRGRSPARGFDEMGTHRSKTGSLEKDDVSGALRSRSRTRSSESRGECQQNQQREMPPRSTHHRRPLSPRNRSPSLERHSSRGESNLLLQPRSRGEILAPRVLAAADFLREIKEPKPKGAPRRPDGKLSRIPMPLFIRETEYDYEEAFGRWLHNRRTSSASLRDKPLKERVYRCQFARQRVMGISIPPTTSRPRSSKRSQSPLSHVQSDQHKMQEPHRVLDRDGGRDSESNQLPRKASRSTSFSSSECPVNNVVGIGHATCELSRGNTDPQNSSGKEESVTGDSDTGMSTSTPSSSPPKSMRADAIISPAHAPQQPLEETTDSLQHTENHIALEDLDSTPSGTPDSQDAPPNWALQLINHVQQLEATVTQLQRKIEACRVNGGIQNCNSCGHELQNFSPDGASSSTHSPRRGDLQDPTSVAGAAVSTSTTTKSNRSIRSLDPNATGVVCKGPLHGKPGGQSKTGAAKEPASYEDIHRDATLNLAHAIQFRVEEDPKKRQLTEEYDHLNQQVMMNETAINDALEYVKAIKDIDDAMAKEQHSQIMELVVSINQEKEKRASALAALIINAWAGKKDTLRSVLNEKPSVARKHDASHEKLGSISSQIERKNDTLKTLEMHLKEQLQWVSDSPSCLSEADKSLRFKALRKLSKRLIKEQTARKHLELQRRDILLSFMQASNEIRQLVANLL